MKVASILPLLALAACAAPSGTPTPFDGRYEGSGRSSHGSCGRTDSYRVRMQVANGHATINLSGSRRITADIAPDGRFQNVTYLGASTGSGFSGASTGSGRIQDGAFTLTEMRQSTTDRNGWTCNYHYEGRRVS